MDRSPIASLRDLARGPRRRDNRNAMDNRLTPRNLCLPENPASVILGRMQQETECWTSSELPFTVC